MSENERTERLQVELTSDELVALEEFRFKGRYPSRAAAVRELLRRGLIEANKDAQSQSH
jgi:Arc/MetJ-type ribon-helix-helix transcriptional regulator